MFCEECGTKNKKNAAFCENCGHKMQEVEESTTNTVNKAPKKPMDKKTKIIVGVVCAVLVVLIGLYTYLGSLCKPENVALKYFKAYMNNDASALYDTLNLEDSKFVSKKILKEQLKDEEKTKLANYSVKETEKEDLSATVKIAYVEDGSSKEKTQKIKLTKNKKSKWLFFDNWTVDSSELVAKEYTIYVPKDSTFKIDGTKISDKYKEDSYSSSYDKYVIPSILKGKYTLTIKLESGIEVEDEMTVNSGEYGSYRVSSIKLPSKTEKALIKDMKATLKTLYEAAIDDKDFDEIKDNFDEDYQDDIKYRYETIKDGMKSSYKKLNSIDFTDIEIKTVSIDEENICLYVNIKYKYKLTYKSGDEEKEFSSKEKSNTSYIYYTNKDGKNIITDLKYLNYYYSYY